jgi:hypothetical protein
MRKLMFLVAGATLVFGSIAVADDFSPPSWYSTDTWNTTLTRAEWTFATNPANNGGAATSYVNPYGAPTCAATGYGVSWLNYAQYGPTPSYGLRQGVLQAAVQGDNISLTIPNQSRSDLVTQVFTYLTVAPLNPNFTTQSRFYVTESGTTPLYPTDGFHRDANPGTLMSVASDGWYHSPNPWTVKTASATQQVGVYLKPGPSGTVDPDPDPWTNGYPVWLDQAVVYTRQVPKSQIDGHGIGAWNEQNPGAYTAEWLPGDLNEDGYVNLGDLNILSDNYGKTSAAWYEGDINFDGTVNLGDLNILSDHYGQGGGVAPIPEPSTAVLALLLGAMGLAWRLRRRLV